MTLDLDTKHFPQRKLLELVPGLKPASIRNWIERHLLDVGGARPGKAGQLLYSPMDAVRLTFVTQMVRLGVAPAPAFGMAMMIEERVRQLWASAPEEFTPDPDDPISLKAWKVGEYRRGYIYSTAEDGPQMRASDALSSDTMRLHFLPTTYITVEIDVMALHVLKRAQRVKAGLPAFFPPREPDA
ncbi:hypothetical protein RUR49_19020 [Pseudoxanthobacter sp. M-2]|uniref:hypothetical protein n=1 Tax=Pseudoxanthobacter sp. M-2 TaxID=3078754 RepID=UPI0038FCE7C8